MSKINYWKIMTRRKPLPQQECEESKLGRVFGTFDLTALGVSATLGVGVYVLAGHVAKDQSGPSVILSFLIAAFASFLAGLCYAEFSSRVPKSGSAYIFTYVAIGEFLAFIVGWNLILEYVIGAASISRGLSLYIDSLIQNSMKTYFRSIAPMSWDFLSGYFDFFAFGCPLLIGLALAFGLRKSAGINNILCLLNLGVVVYVVIAVLFNADINNWKIDPVNIPAEYADKAGVGGFFPFGFSGTLKGAATCFFGFVGFDCIATTGEEVRNPQRTVPRALMFSLLVIFIAYFGVSLLTLMWPYYLLDAEAPLPHAFQEIGWITSKWIVTIGGIVGLLASLFGALFPLPRILYAMAQDGLIFRDFGIISDRFKTPVIGTLSAALLTSFFAALFDLAALVSMLSIGVLLAYTVVAISIIILRFSQAMEASPTGSFERNETSNLLRPGYNITAKGFVMQLIRMNTSRQPNTISMWVVGSMIVCYCAVCFALGITIIYSWDAIAAGETWALAVTISLAGLLAVLCALISIQPRHTFTNLSKPFKVPLVPILPAVSVFINIYLMLMLDYYTWIRFGIWMFLGLPIYLVCARFYNSSNENSSQTSVDTNNRTFNGDPSIEVANDLKIETKTEKLENGVVEINGEIEHDTITVHNINSLGQGDSAETPDLKLSTVTEESETNSAIEMLDTVLEGEGETDSANSEMNSEKSSIKSQISQSSVETIETVVFIREDMEAEVDEILLLAQAAVNKIRAKSLTKTGQKEFESVFENTEFLDRLNYLISKSNSRLNNRPKATNRTTKTLHENKNPKTLGKSKSVPDLQHLLEPLPSLSDSKNEEVNDSKIPRPPPVFSEELLRKAATLKTVKTERKVNEEEVEEEEVEEEEIALGKTDIREKLEKMLILQAQRPMSTAPIPMPRNNKTSETAPENGTSSEPQHVKPEISNILADPLRTMQRDLFNEVLKKIKKQDSDTTEDIS